MNFRTFLMPAFAVLVLATPVAMAVTFTDSNYHEVVLVEWDTAHLDVLVLPPVAPAAVWRIPAIDQSIDAWEAGLDADSALAGVDIVRYTPAVDPLPPAGFEIDDPEIIVALSTEPGAIGIGIPWDYFVCDPVDQFVSTPDLIQDVLARAHQHEGSPWAVVSSSSECRDNTENVCLVLSTNWETIQNGMYDLVAHEFGHCLGIGHVGDAGDFTAANFPGQDIMSYQHTPSHVHCVSSLNQMALKVSFATVLSITPPSTTTYEGFRYVQQTPGSYSRMACANPPVSALDTDWFPLE